MNPGRHSVVALAVARSRGWDPEAYASALARGDEDAISLAHPYNFLDEEQVELEAEAMEVQHLIDIGAWSLEGAVGRAMMRAIEAGVCVLGEEGHRDYWGNYIPSRSEVQPGTLGSIEYAITQWGAAK